MNSIVCECDWPKCRSSGTNLRFDVVDYLWWSFLSSFSSELESDFALTLLPVSSLVCSFGRELKWGWKQAATLAALPKLKERRATGWAGWAESVLLCRGLDREDRLCLEFCCFCRRCRRCWCCCCFYCCSYSYYCSTKEIGSLNEVSINTYYHEIQHTKRIESNRGAIKFVYT